MMEGFGIWIAFAVVKILPLILAITTHEAAHGFVALKCGDDTALRMGRLTFNPLKHVDPFGTIVLPGFLLLLGAPFVFGYAKPVPVNFGGLRSPRRDMVLVALAGPGVNIAMAIASSLFLNLWSLDTVLGAIMIGFLQTFILYNVVLAVFNMIPILPLDGGRVLVGLLPPALGNRLQELERYGMILLLGLLFVIPMVGMQLNYPISPISGLIQKPISVILEKINGLHSIKQENYNGI